MTTIFYSSGQGKKHYTVTSIDTLRKNLSEFHGIKIKRRWTFQCLRYLLDAGYIRRKGRYVHDNNGIITQIPSVMTLTLKGMAWLMSRGVRGAKKIYRTMVKWLKKEDKRFPRRSQFDDGSWRPPDPGMQEGLEYMLGLKKKQTE
jgi:hypothetical protein